MIFQPKIKSLIIGGVLFIPFVLGYLYPDDWWGTHFIYFLPEVWGVLLAGVISLIVLMSIYVRPEGKVINGLKQLTPDKSIYIVAAIYALIFYLFPIVSDYYGNARSFIPILDTTVTSFPTDAWDFLFNLEIKPGQGRRNVMHLYSLISFIFDITYRDVFILAGALCGGLFVLIWLKYVSCCQATSQWKIVLALMGLSTPFLLIFFGHIDTYAPLYLLVLYWLIQFKHQFENPNQRTLILLGVLLMVGTRFHALMFLFVPAYFLLIVNFYFNGHSQVIKMQSLKGMLQWIYLPCCAIGIIVYFFVLEDYKDPRTLENFEDIDRLFLPILTPEAPLDRYNLFSWNHLFDLLNLIYLWSPIALYILISTIVPRFKHVIFNNPGLSAILLTFLLVSSFLFMFNPLLSMPMDWDVFSFPSILLMTITLFAVEKLHKNNLPRGVLSISLGLALLSTPIFFVHGSNDILSNRLESVGVHVYKSYYAHSSTYMLYALNMIPNDPGLYMARKRKLIEKLQPVARPGIDSKYADLLIDDGIYKLKYLNQLKEAASDFNDALHYFPKSYQARELLIETYLKLNRKEEAFQISTELVRFNYPSTSISLKTAIHCAIEANKLEKALDYCNDYLKLDANNLQVIQLKNGLLNGLSQEELLKIIIQQ